VRKLSARRKDRGSLLDRPDGQDMPGAVAGRFRLRDRINRSPGLNLTYRITVGVVGGLVILAGMFMIPYPGPGWLMVFAGLAILATEFTWAEAVLRYIKRRYDSWNEWLKRQHPVVRAVMWIMTATVVVVTLWLLDVYQTVGGWFGLDWSWLSSPIL
jgi:uncharacterized protein (TIGR02611 family)